ncbi:MAG: FAD-binding oxidoreductase [Candidatus Alcyoniella australis]|nr:FAD-binding oxidoreductase [Candidatus Alcyoniella australis]
MAKIGRTVIVGGGVLGLALGYNLCRMGHSDVVVLEKLGLNQGASGRCGGGVRQQWTNESNIEWMIEAVRCFARFPQEMGINIWFRQCGYLFLAASDEQAEQFARNVKFQNEHGVPTKLLDPAGIKRVQPELQVNGFRAGAFNQTDGSMFPFPVLWGYARNIERLGGQVRIHCDVVEFDFEGDKITAVRVNGPDGEERIECERVINAAGAWSPQIGALAGVELPNKAEKHEIIVCEPVEPFMGPATIPMDSGLYCSQMVRGEVVGCVAMDYHEEPDYQPSLGFARKLSRIMTQLFPRLGGVSLLRHWAGYYDITPDTNPILGPLENRPNFVQFHGFMGHGFMLAPTLGRLMAEHLANGAHQELMHTYRPERFAEGGLKRETMIIG